MSGTEIVANVGVAILVLIGGALGFLLHRLFNKADAADSVRLDNLYQAVTRTEQNLSGLGKRHDDALVALNDLIREGFDSAAEDRSELAQRLARLEGALVGAGVPISLIK